MTPFHLNMLITIINQYQFILVHVMFVVFFETLIVGVVEAVYVFLKDC